MHGSCKYLPTYLPSSYRRYVLVGTREPTSIADAVPIAVRVPVQYSPASFSDFTGFCGCGGCTSRLCLFLYTVVRFRFLSPCKNSPASYHASITRLGASSPSGLSTAELSSLLEWVLLAI